MKQVALVVGASCITGSNLAEKLISKGWVTYGLARNPQENIADLKSVSADLLDRESLRTALVGIAPTNAFITSWMRN